MELPKIKNDKYTYADYLTWDDGKRREIVGGFAYDMSPAPTTRHQLILGALFNAFFNFLKGKPCKVFSAPFDVRLGEIKETDEEIVNVVQPDISIICNPMKIDDRGAKGAPDLVVEILSDSSIKTDFGIKLLLYQKYGVKEYWIADPSAKTINVYILDETGKFGLVHIYTDDESLKVGIFPNMEISLKEIFEA